MRRLQDSKVYLTFRIEVGHYDEPDRYRLVFLANDYTEEDAKQFLEDNYNQLQWNEDDPSDYNAEKAWWANGSDHIVFIATLQDEY